jgi:hypothetical protein
MLRRLSNTLRYRMGSSTRRHPKTAAGCLTDDDAVCAAGVPLIGGAQHADIIANDGDDRQVRLTNGHFFNVHYYCNIPEHQCLQGAETADSGIVMCRATGAHIAQDSSMSKHSSMSSKNGSGKSNRNVIHRSAALPAKSTHPPVHAVTTSCVVATGDSERDELAELLLSQGLMITSDLARSTLV